MIVTEIKGYILKRFHHHINNISFTNDALIKRYQEYEYYFAKKINDARTVHIRCNPDKYIENESYVRFIRVIEGYVKREDNLNKENSCAEDCKQTMIQDNTCDDKDYGDCNGTILYCNHKEYKKTETCSSFKDKQLSLRRYQRVIIDDSTILNTGNCKKEAKIESLSEEWKIIRDCSVCFCFYYDPKSDYSHRFVSLKKMEANKNKVVTGIRLVKKEQVIHLQIQEGELQVGNYIDEKSVEWKDFELKDLNKNRNPSDTFIISPIDKRITIDLDNIIAEKGYVITGMMFQIVYSFCYKFLFVKSIIYSINIYLLEYLLTFKTVI